LRDAYQLRLIHLSTPQSDDVRPLLQTKLSNPGWRRESKLPPHREDFVSAALRPACGPDVSKREIDRLRAGRPCRRSSNKTCHHRHKARIADASFDKASQPKACRRETGARPDNLEAPGPSP